MQITPGTMLYVWILLLFGSGFVVTELITVFGSETLMLECGQQSIVIEKVWYGGSDEGSSCVKPNAWKAVATYCFKASFCNVYLNLVNSPDPCPGQAKKLEVQFSCTDADNILDSCLAHDTRLDIGRTLYVVSPNYPRPYNASLDCDITIDSPAILHKSDLKIEVVFMQMQHRLSSNVCYDKLVIQEPGNPAKIYEYCGPTPNHSQNPVTLLMEKAKFTTLTDELTNQNGFVVKITNITWSTSCPKGHPCLNGAQCAQSQSGSNHFCHCAVGFYGDTCAHGFRQGGRQSMQRSQSFLFRKVHWYLIVFLGVRTVASVWPEKTTPGVFVNRDSSVRHVRVMALTTVYRTHVRMAPCVLMTMTTTAVNVRMDSKGDIAQRL